MVHLQYCLQIKNLELDNLEILINKYSDSLFKISCSLQSFLFCLINCLPLRKLLKSIATTFL